MSTIYMADLLPTVIACVQQKVNIIPDRFEGPMFEVLVCLLHMELEGLLDCKVRIVDKDNVTYVKSADVLAATSTVSADARFYYTFEPTPTFTQFVESLTR
jgi:hypothetical protein